MAGWDSSKLRQARVAAGMSQGDVCAKLIKIRRRSGMPPKLSSLKRMYIDWEKGRVYPADWIDELCEVFELPKSVLGFVETETPSPSPLELPPTLEVLRVDADTVALLDQQTNLYRITDRKLGAAIIPQTTAHVQHMQRILRNALPGDNADALALALAEAAALAGWQALDAGDVSQAWQLHDIAKAAARQGNDAAIAAHVTMQQGYALLDSGRAHEAVEIAQYANRPELTKRAPSRLRAWLAAAEAEFRANAGDELTARRLFDHAAGLLPPGDTDADLPFLMLNEAHLARWRGNALAALGADEAIEDLTAALEGIPTLTSARAETGLRVDLAIALRQRGDVAASKQQAQRAAELASRAGSVRQRRRIAKLLAA